MKPQSDLLSWQVTNPSNLQDHLPQPYRLIDQVLRETILYQLQLNMHYIQEKKKDANYEGKVQEYIAQSLIQLESDICCVSSSPKYQNYLLAGDRKGNLLVIDVAKKSLFCKKELSPGKRINFITESTIYDGETYITISAVISNNCSVIKILRSKHNDSKIFVVADVQVTEQQQNVNKFPYQCHLEDDARLLVVKTFDGSIVAFALPEVRIDEDRVKQQFSLNETLSNASNSIKKPTIYPLESIVMDKNHGKITEKLFQIKFEGHEKPLKYKDILNRLKNKSKPIEQIEAPETAKKDPKKDAKKLEVPATQVPKQSQKQILQNQKINKKQTVLWNNNDITEPYHNPKFSPFYYILYQQVECPRKKSFEKGKNIKMCTKIIYGWTNTKEVYTVNLLTQKSPSYENTAYYQQFLQSQILLTEEQISKLEISYRKSFSSTISQKNTHTCFKTVYPITCTSISRPDMSHLALGLQNGTIAIYSCDSLTLQYTTEKHSSKVTVVSFFQNGWKVISGSENGEVYISNLDEQKPQMKMTHLFEPKENTPVVDIKVNNDIGMAYVIDVKGNVRVYDLWRNEKISRLVPCNAFSMAEDKGKRWVPAGHLCSTSTIYSNRDYSVLLSIDWPNIPTSKAQQVPKEVIQKVNELERNPWKSADINLHVIRNFEFLLDHFDGLQSVYKKGYEKAKIMNLFTNLQFTQLYDRNFDIPDFGRTVNITGGNKNSSTKSNLSSTSKFNSSNRGMGKKSSSKDKMGSSSSSPSKDTPGGHTRNVKLTTKVLHPEKFLFERRQVEMKNLPTSNEKLIETIREEHKKKQRRANMLQDELNRTSGGI